MTIATIIVANPTDPVEVQTWFDDHPMLLLANVRILAVNSNIFYVIY